MKARTRRCRSALQRRDATEIKESIRAKRSAQWNSIQKLVGEEGQGISARSLQCSHSREPACGCATCCVVCTGCEVCAVNCLVSGCPVCFCAWGAAVCHCAAEGARIPTLRVTTAVTSPRTLFPTPARLCTKRSRGFPPSSLNSWIHRSGQRVKLTPGSSCLV